MVVGGRQVGPNISEAGNLLGFSPHNRRRMARLLQADRKAIVTQITTCYKKAPNKMANQCNILKCILFSACLHVYSHAVQFYIPSSSHSKC